MDNPYKVHITPDRVFVKIFEKASYLNCDPLRKFFEDQLKSGHSQFILDFQDCSMIDSTFLGIVVSLTLKNRKKTNDGCVVLLNLKGRNLETVQNLGIHQIANVSEQPITCEKELENLSDNSDNSAADTQTIYDAHKALMSLNDKNLKVFSDVVSYLEQRKDTK